MDQSYNNYDFFFLFSIFFKGELHLKTKISMFCHLKIINIVLTNSMSRLKQIVRET